MSNDGLWHSLKPELVPAIGDGEIAEMRRIRPLLREPDSCWYRKIKGSDTIDPRGMAFTWGAEPYDVAMAFSPLNKVDIITLHEYGAPSLFKPSLAEVYGAIRRYCPDFSKIWYFYLHSENMDAANIVGGCHWCKCTLFGSCDHFEQR